MLYLTVGMIDSFEERPRAGIFLVVGSRCILDARSQGVSIPSEYAIVNARWLDREIGHVEL